MPVEENGQCKLRPLNFGGRERNTISRLQDLVRAGRLPVGELFLEQFRNSDAIADLDMVGEAAPIIIDQKNLHANSL